MKAVAGLTLLCSTVLSTAAHSLLYQSENTLQQPSIPDEKVWLFAVDGLKRPYSFETATGDLVGFDVDLIAKVCEIAGKKCKMVLQPFQECAFTSRDMNYPGRGLMAGWFDACPGYTITRDRQSGFEFTNPYLNTVATFSVAPGNPSNFNPKVDDYSQFTLCHLTGAPTNARCLNRLKKKFSKFIIANDLPEARNLLLNNTVQAAFSPRTRIDGLEVLPEIFHCDENGAGIMVKKGSTLPQWWNPSFDTFNSTGGYYELCRNASQTYFYPIKCM